MIWVHPISPPTLDFPFPCGDHKRKYLYTTSLPSTTKGNAEQSFPLCYVLGNA